MTDQINRESIKIGYKQGINKNMTAQKVTQSENTSIFATPEVSAGNAVPLKIPVTLVLNTVGLSMMSIKDSKRDRGSSAYEVTLKEYKPEVIQKLLIQSCLRRIDISLDDVIANRREIIDFSKLIMFSVLYRQFRREVFEMTVRSPLIKQWNRQNPRQQIDASSDTLLMKMERSLLNRKEEVNLFRQTMMNRLWSDHGYLFQGDDDHQKRMGMAGKLLRNIHPFTQVVLLDYSKAQDVRVLTQNILSKLALYLKRFSLPEYNALVLLEYLQCSERENLVAEYNHILQSNGRQVSEYPMNEMIRKELIKRKITPQTRFSFMFENRSSQTRGNMSRLRMMILSGERESRGMNDILFHRKSTVRLKKSIKDYLEKECKDSCECANPEILHYYMNHLEEVCRETGCNFSSFVNYDNDHSISITHMIFDC